MSFENLIFITVFNNGGIELALNHYKSLTVLGITNYMAYVTDEESVRAMQEHGYNVTFIENANVDKNAMEFCKGDFNKLSFLRYHIAGHLIRSGKDVWYMDVDTVLLQDVRYIYEIYKNTGIHICIQDDINMPCSGCVLYMASEDTARFTDIVIKEKDKYANDQYTLANVLNSIPELVHSGVLKNQINFALFYKCLFPNGLLFFGEEFVNTPIQYQQIKDEYKNSGDKPFFVHANWMIGNDKKKAAFKKYGLWFL
jgi:hypothetical protein